MLGLARNERLRSLIDDALEQASRQQQQTGRPARVFTEFEYQTLESWSRARRVVGKAEQLVGKENPRYVVTSLDGERWPPQRLYEQLYCERGEAENRIKEQLSLFADRMSSADAAGQSVAAASVVAGVGVAGGAAAAGAGGHAAGRGPRRRRSGEGC